MLKQKIMSNKQAEKLIFDMVKFSDHSQHDLRNLQDFQIKDWFQQNNRTWKELIADIVSGRAVPFVENLIGYSWTVLSSDNDNITTTSHQHGHETAALTGTGQISVFDYHTKFMKTFEERTSAINSGNYSDLLSCVTHSVAAVESYITSKANIWNKNGKQPQFPVEKTITLDEKLNDWLFTMTGHKMNQDGYVWNHFTDYKNLNNTIFKHNITGSHAASYQEMVKIINKFRTGIAELLFILHRQFNDPVPSKIIRSIYLPDVFITK